MTYISETVRFLVRVVEQTPDGSYLGLQTNWGLTDDLTDPIILSEHRKRQALQEFTVENIRNLEYIYPDLTIEITDDNNREVRKRLLDLFDDSDICHCFIISGDTVVLESYDGLQHNTLDRQIKLDGIDIEFEYRED